MGYAAIALLIIGLVGQGFEMRKIRLAAYKDEDLDSAKVFVNERNFKWYAIIGVGIILWYAAELM